VREFDEKHKHEQWSEEEMAAAEGWLKSPVLRKNLAILKWTMMVITFAAAWRWHHSAAFSTTFYLSLVAAYWISPSNQLLALRKRVTPLPPREPQGGWSGTIGRLHSDHWGGRPPVAGNS
jgi:hypothetical protein